MSRSRRGSILAVAAISIAALLATPAASAEGPHSESVPSFGESPGCGALDGVGGPRMGSSGFQVDSTPVYGPWGDFFGRTIGDVRDQLEPVYLPGLEEKALYLHDRVLPAFQLVLDTLADEAAQGNVYAMTPYTWSFNPATIPPTTKLSFHGIGAAIDVNSLANPYSADNILITDMIDEGADNPYWYIDAWRDAGFCWGGDWQTIKDPMHFSWMGPIHTPGYDMSAFPPQPPDAAYSSYSDNPAFPEVQYGVVFDTGPDPGPYVAVDLDANGAADVVRLRHEGDGTVVLEVSRARHEYTRSSDWAWTTTPPTDSAAPLALSDVTGDARPDLVYLLEQEDGSLTFEIFPLVQGGALVPISVPTDVPSSVGAVYLFDDFDMDGVADLYVVRPGSPGSIEVWLGASGYSEAHVTVDADLPADSRYATGDRDFDGTADLFVLAADGGLRIMIGADPAFEAVGSISAAHMDLDPTGETFFVDDLDGDGHPDLLLVDASGDLRMRRGGFSTHDPGVWFVVESEIGSDPPPDPVRIAGADRYETAVAASKVSHPDGADVVYVAVGTNYPDASAAGPAAAAEGAPILLVRSTSIPGATSAELLRLAPDLVVVLGGPVAVSEGVEADLEDLLPGTTVDRRWGATRYETAVAVTQAAFDPGVDTVFVTTGQGFADPLVTAVWAVKEGEPLLLTQSSSIPTAVVLEIERLAPSRIVIVGNTSSVSSQVEQELAAIAPIERVSASDRYSLSAAVAQASHPHGASTAYIAVGTVYPDALAAGPLTGDDPGPLLLVETNTLPPVVAQELARLDPHDVIVMGGPAAVSDAVVSEIATYQG